MLTLAAKVNEKIWIGKDVSLWFYRSPRGHFRVAIDAPKDVVILRDSVRRKMTGEDDAADETPS